MTVKIKTDMLVSCIFSHLLYASEARTTNRNDSKKLLAF